MSAKRSVDRRTFLGRGLAIASASLLSGCDSGLSDQPWVKRILDSAEALSGESSLFLKEIFLFCLLVSCFVS